MILSVISDIHANTLALKLALEDSKKNKVDKYIFLGDYLTDGEDTNKILNYALAKQKDNLFMFFKDNSSLDYQRKTKRKLDISKISKRPITEFMADKTKFPKRREFKQIYFDRNKEFERLWGRTFA